ncbi:hypothetical protein [Bradyrhizobium sp. P5_C11_2]
MLDEIDRGRSLVDYGGEYWENELSAARSRSYGPALARVAEVFLYARRSIDVFLDIGAGAGFLLDACATYLPNSKHRFFGIEKFPPAGLNRTNSNLITGEIAEINFKVDAGCCIEVIEHLTPSMLREMLSDISVVANENSIFIFNSGQPSFVRNENPAYLDPRGRGHIMSYSLSAISKLAEPAGFRVHALEGKTWAFILEKTLASDTVPMKDRIWTPVQANLDVLNDPDMGSLMHILGIETARAYG